MYFFFNFQKDPGNNLDVLEATTFEYWRERKLLFKNLGRSTDWFNVTLQNIYCDRLQYEAILQLK